jgi:hypothetical protein
LLKKGEGRGEREENPQIMEEKCGEPLDIADERERERESKKAAWRIPMLLSLVDTTAYYSSHPSCHQLYSK